MRFRCSIFAVFILASSAVVAKDVSSSFEQWNLDKLGAIDPAREGFLTHSSLLLDASGRVVWQWGDLNQKLPVYSVRKSLLSSLFGIIIAEGDLATDTTLAELGIDDKQGLTDSEKQATVRDLLQSRSGVYHPAAYETPGMDKNRPERGQYATGEHWYYNNWDFNTLSTIFETASGQSIGDAFYQKVAVPSGMQDFTSGDVEYVLEDASVHPAATFRMTALDLSRFGLIMLNGGLWNGVQIIPANWVSESTRVSSDLGMFGGYGYSWWVAAHGDHLPRLQFPDGAYSARGSGEQMVLIIPSINAVWVHRTAFEPASNEQMHVMELAKLLGLILDAHAEGDAFADPRFSR